MTGTGAVTVGNGGTLSGIGYVQSKASTGVTVQSGGKILAGVTTLSLGALTLDRSQMTTNNVLTLNKGGVLAFDLNAYGLPCSISLAEPRP